MKEFILGERLSITEVNTTAQEVKKGGYDMIRSYDQVEVDFAGLQMLILLNKTDQVQVEIKVVESSVELLSKVGFKSNFEDGSLRLK